MNQNMKMKKILLVIVAICFSAALFAAGERQTIWTKGKMPNRQEQQIAAMTDETGTEGFNPDRHRVAYLEWFDAPAEDVRNGGCMILISGGSYRNCCDVKLSKHTTAWQDLQRAIRLVKQQAQERGLDPERIGIMGGSAGGHLTLMGITAYALTDGINDINTDGGNDDGHVLVPEFSFDLCTAPMLFVHGDADKCAAMISVKVWEKMLQMGIQSELHTLATRDHCFQLSASPGTGSYTYLDRIWEFLTAKGFNR